jgi:hypothetical protein
MEKESLPTLFCPKPSRKKEKYGQKKAKGAAKNGLLFP